MESRILLHALILLWDVRFQSTFFGNWHLSNPTNLRLTDSRKIENHILGKKRPPCRPQDSNSGRCLQGSIALPMNDPIPSWIIFTAVRQHIYSTSESVIIYATFISWATYESWEITHLCNSPSHIIVEFKKK